MSLPIEVQSVLSGPEFWMSVAFVGVVAAAVRPLSRYLKNWGKARADKIADEVHQADALCAKAQALLNKYKAHTAHKEKERQAVLDEGKKEIAFLKQQAADQLRERIQNKTDAVHFRLDIIRENSGREMKEQMTDALLKKTRHLLQEAGAAQKESDTDKALEMIFGVLESHRADVRHP